MAKIVVGAQYGDEGKGLMTDFLSNKNTTVVRHNSGAQAGHTVVTQTGVRHTFHHIGSGSFRGAETYLSRFFVANPILFRDEWQTLSGKGVQPQITIHPDCMVTTPFDMMVNQAKEIARGVDRHGSCGMGFGDTIERHDTIPFTVRDLTCPRTILERIRDYSHVIISTLGVDMPVMNEAILVNFIHDCAFMLDKMDVADHSYLRDKEIVFESAQGLLLDMDHENFPHVTRSSTGIKNAVSIMEDIHETHLTAHYMTRAYVTRHGAGPLPNEEPMPSWVVDETNIPNDWQGSLRFAPLNVPSLRKEIDKDLLHAGKVDVTDWLTVTCLDQVPDLDPSFLPNLNGFFPRLMTSWGPTRDTMKVFSL